MASCVAEMAKDFEAEPVEMDLKLPMAGNGKWEVGGGTEDEEIDDELYEEAKKLVVEAQKASASYLQRRLRIGYARAASILDMLEERGVIGPGEGAKPRAVLVKRPAAQLGGETAKLENEREIELEEEAIDEEEEESSGRDQKKEQQNKKPLAKRASGDDDIPYTNFDF